LRIMHVCSRRREHAAVWALTKIPFLLVWTRSDRHTPSDTSIPDRNLKIEFHHISCAASNRAASWRLKEDYDLRLRVTDDAGVTVWNQTAGTAARPVGG
jgi:hypothetical protein